MSPPVLEGREQAHARAAELLARTANFGSPGRSPVILTGVRGVGKTVLLNAITAQASTNGFVTAAVVVDRHGPLPSRLAAALGEAMRPLQPTGSSSKWRRWLEYLRRLQVEVTVPGVKIATHGKEPSEVHREQATARDQLVSLLAQSADLARATRPGLLLAWMSCMRVLTSMGAVTGVAQELVGSALVVIGAGLPQTPNRLMAAGSYAERFQYQRLGFLSPVDAATALLAPAAASRVAWDQDAADHVLGAADGAPYLLQLYGDAAWRLAGPPRAAESCLSMPARESQWPATSSPRACSVAAGTEPARWSANICEPWPQAWAPTAPPAAARSRPHSAETSPTCRPCAGDS